MKGPGLRFQLNHPTGLSLALVVFLLCQPVVALLQALLYALAAVSLSATPADWLETLLQLALRDPRHASIAVEALQEVHISGFVIGWPIGDLISVVIPGIDITAPAGTTTRWASAVIQPGSTLLASVAAHVLAAMLLLALGRALVHLRKAGQEWAIGVGVMAQVVTVMDLLRQPLTIRDLDTMGLSTIATKVFSASVPDYQSLVAPFERLQHAGIPVAPLLLVLTAFGPVYVLPSALGWLSRAVFWVSARPQSSIHMGGTSSARKRAIPDLRRAGLVIGIVLLTLSPLQWVHGGPSFRSFSVAQAQAQPEVAGVLDDGRDASDNSPSAVEIAGQYPEYRLLANGVPLQVRGLGYNVYASHLGREERSAHYARDFSVMASMGLNTVLGWEQSEFDEVLLDAAHEAGLWVILPFQLPPQVEHVNYADAGTRATLKASIREWVWRFKDHPAVLMYAPGNEVLTAMRTYAPQKRAQQRAYVSFYRDLADMIHAVDPHHPVICREAEVGHLDLLRDAFHDGVSRPWFVLGTNLYGSLTTLKAGLAQREGWSWRLPGMVTEFAPVGYRSQDRPHLVTQMAQTVEAANLMGWVLYVWTTEGPEPLDRSFGIVDGYARPTDGTLSALSRLTRAPRHRAT